MTEERKVALITGITGQDGSYLTELLLEKGYTVGIYQENPIYLLINVFMPILIPACVPNFLLR